MITIVTRSREELVKEVEERNKARCAAQLPLLNVETEVKKSHQAERNEAYWNWYYNHPLY
jgi:hypothetical protein